MLHGNVQVHAAQMHVCVWSVRVCVCKYKYMCKYIHIHTYAWQYAGARGANADPSHGNARASSRDASKRPQVSSPASPLLLLPPPPPPLSWSSFRGKLDQDVGGSLRGANLRKGSYQGDGAHTYIGATLSRAL
jgi:hypothetical protein